MKRTLNIIFLILTITVMVLIFFFSSQNGDESSSTSSKVVEFFLSIFIRNFKGLGDTERIEYIEKYSHLVRKLAHFSEFAALGFSLTMYLSTLKREIVMRKRFLYSFLSGVFYAFLDEGHQAFSPSRSPSLKDVLIDSSGVLTGALIALLIVYLVERRHKHTANKRTS